MINSAEVKATILFSIEAAQGGVCSVSNCGSTSVSRISAILEEVPGIENSLVVFPNLCKEHLRMFFDKSLEQKEVSNDNLSTAGA